MTKNTHQYLWLVIAMLMILFSVGFAFKFVFGASTVATLSHAEIDQLEMQATFAKDQNSLQQLQYAAENQQVEAQLALGKTLLFKHQSSSAMHWLGLAAQAGNPEAATVLGKLYFNGHEQIAQNYPLAMRWFHLAYEKKDPTAGYYLGLMYKNGYGTQIQTEQAVKYFDQAAKQHIPSAMFMLANAYQFGEGVKQDLSKALYWYKVAADLELPEAIQELAHIYQYGNSAVKADQTIYQQQLLEIGHALKHPAIMP